MAELLSSASAWVNGGRAVASALPTSFSSLPARGTCAAVPLEVALPFGTSPSFGGGIAPVHHMGGGPRTFPGGVNKWQWKRMQLKKSRQIEKARLMREKHIYEARRRAELLAASPVLEMPWQRMSRVRPPNYVTADEQVTKLAARFQREGAEDLWTEKDGPERFEVMDNELPSHFSPAMVNSQGKSQWGPQQSKVRSDELWNKPQDAEPTSQYAQSFRDPPRIRPTSAPKSDRRYNQSSRDLPRIRPASAPQSDPYYKGMPRDSYK